MDFFNNINLAQNELQNAVAQNLSAAPLNPKRGQLYFNTGGNRLLYYNGSRWISAADDNTTYTFETGTVNGQIKITDSGGNVQSVSVKGLAGAAYKGVDSSVPAGSSSANLPTSAAVAAAISAAVSASDAMRFKGTVGTGGTVTALPAAAVNTGDTYKAVSAGTYGGQSAKAGDMFIALSPEPAWAYIPSGDDGNAYRYASSNPALTASSGICTWTVTHGLGNKYPLVQLYEISTGEMVMADITAISTSQLKVLINSAANIAAGAYRIIVIG